MFRLFERQSWASDWSYNGSNILAWEFIYKLYLVYSVAPHMPLRSLHDEKEWHTSQSNGFKHIEDYERNQNLLIIVIYSGPAVSKTANMIDKIYDMLEMVVKDNKDRILINEKYKKDLLLVSSKLLNFLSKRSSAYLLSLPFESATKLGLPS